MGLYAIRTGPRESSSFGDEMAPSHDVEWADESLIGILCLSDTFSDAVACLGDYVDGEDGDIDYEAGRAVTPCIAYWVEEMTIEELLELLERFDKVQVSRHDGDTTVLAVTQRHRA